MNTLDQLKVIHNWTYRLDISLDSLWAKIIYVNNYNSNNNYEYTPTCESYQEMIDTAYHIVRNRVWKHLTKI